ncbi:hypothetical protein [Mycolicibacterium fortuitum]
MKFTINTTTLAETVNAVANAIPGVPPVPILGGILIEPAIGAVTLNGYDYERSISMTAGADVGDVDGPALVSGRLLSTVAKLLPGGKVATVNTDGGSSMLIECGKATFALPMMHAEDYPQLPGDVGQTFATMDVRDLVGLVDTVAGFTAKPPVNPAELVAVHIEADAGEMILSATDRYVAILGRAKGYEQISKEPVALNIPGVELVKALAPWRKAPGMQIELAVDGGTFIVHTGSASSTLRTIAASSPNWYPKIARLFPSEFACICRVDTRAITEMLGRVGAFDSRDHARSTLTIADGTITARNTSHDGVAQDGATNTEFSGQKHEFTCNPNKLTSIINAMGTRDVILGFDKPGRMAAAYPGIEDIPDAADTITPLSFDRAALVIGARK